MANKISWGPILSELQSSFSFSQIKQFVGYAEIDMSRLRLPE